MLLIDQMRFEVDHRRSSFGAVINRNRASWFVELECASTTVDDEPLRPVVSIEGVPLPVRSWRDLSGRHFDLGLLKDENLVATMCVGEHGLIFGTHIRFGTRSGSNFEFELDCLTEDGIFHPTEPSIVRVHDEIRFKGILVRSHERPPATQSEAINRLAEHLDPTDLVFDEMQGDDFWFRPMT